MQAQMSNLDFDAIASVASRAFLAKGFARVSVRAIAGELGIKAASLYHHCPGGKAELYQRSICNFLDGYADRLLAARQGSSFPESLLRMATFTLGQNHIDLRRVISEDLPNLSKSGQEEVSESIHKALLGPFVDVLEAAKESDKVRSELDSSMAAACVLAVADNLGGLHLPVGSPVSPEAVAAAEALVREGVSLVLQGILA